MDIDRPERLVRAERGVGMSRRMEAVVKRDAISWWAEVRYEGSSSYIRSTSCITEWGARFAARRLLKRYIKQQRERGIDVQYVVARSEAGR